MNYIKIDNMDIANGEGVGVTLWVSGCTLRCPECHNQSTWDFNCGKQFDDDAMMTIIKYLNSDYINRLTITGGHPFEKENLDCVYEIVKKVKKIYPNKKIWIYTGLEYEDIIADDKILNILNYTDIVVDGKFDINLKDITLRFRGSSNQRIIDIQKSLRCKKLIGFV